MAAAAQLPCFKCGKTLSFPEGVGFRAECQFCREDAHVCKNCEFYDPKVYNECRETAAEVVREKERNNYCEFFQARSGGVDSALKQKDALMSAAEALFKKKS